MFIKSISCEIFERGFTPSEQRKSLHPSLPRLARDSGYGFGWCYFFIHGYSLISISRSFVTEMMSPVLNVSAVPDTTLTSAGMKYIFMEFQE